MRVFVYEYTCAAVGPGRIPGSLAAEGRAMLSAVAQDFAGAPGVEVVTLLHEDFGPEPDLSGCLCIRSTDEGGACRDLARTADATLVIAPEFNNLLATCCRWVLEAGGRLLGPSPAAVNLTADKLALGRHLRGRGVPTPCAYLSTDQVAISTLPYPVVWKPRHGAGSLATVLVRTPADLEACAAIQGAELPEDEAIVQPFVPGLPASVALLIGPRQVVPLLPGAQHLSADGRFRYQGGSMPLPAELAGRAIGLGHRAVAAVPELRGYVGVDLVLGGAADGSGDRVLEINPRLTTSYLGLRALARTNLALALLRVVAGQELVTLAWGHGSVEFTAKAKVTRS